MSNRNGEPICTELMRRLIDFTDDERRCLLLKGEWYFFNDDYVQYLQASISELEFVYNPQYDFSDTKLKDYVEKKYQAEKNFEKYIGLSEDIIRKKLKINIMLNECTIIFCQKNLSMKIMIEIIIK